MKTILTHLLLILCLNISAQTDVDPLKKYWYYRNRLQYFVVPGIGQGKSCVAANRNRDNELKIDYADQTIQLGWYIGMLATEYSLLSQNNQNCNKTLCELYYAFEAFKRLDRCESYYGKPPDLEDGFFMRYDTPNSLVAELNKGLTSADNNVIDRAGSVAYVDDVVKAIDDPLDELITPMSQDQAIHMLIGLALTNKCLPNLPLLFYDKENNLISYNFNETARDITHLIIRRLQNYLFRWGLSPWVIWKPNYWTADPDYYNLANFVPLGGNCLGYAYGLAVAGQKITGKNYFLLDEYLLPLTGPVQDNFPVLAPTPQYLVWQSAKQSYGWTFPGDIDDPYTTDVFKGFVNRMSLIIASIGNSWQTDEFSFLCGCIVHKNTTYDDIKELASLNNSETFFLLLWAYLNDKSAEDIDIGVIVKAQLQILTAPCSGPYAYDNSHYAENGWNTVNRFRADNDEMVIGQDIKGNFNGIDYMLLHNLFRLNNLSTSFTPFIDYTDRELTAHLPHKLPGIGNIGTDSEPAEFDAINKITSTQTIGITNQFGQSVTGNVTYRAGNEIDLKPGFTVEKGAYFNASVEQFDCNSNLKSMDTTNNLYDFVINSYDSLFSPYYYTPYDENYVAELEMLKDAKIELPKPDTVKFNNYDIFSIAAYPNPFNNTTTIEYNIPYSSDVNISIFDIYGAKIMQPVNQYLEKGEHSNTINMSHISKGIYYCKLSSGNESKTIKLVLSN